MTAQQRRITTAISVMVGLTFLVSAGLTFLVTPMTQGLGLPSVEEEFALAIPAIASLIIIFIAGQFGDRYGARRTLTAASLAFALGGATVAVAESKAMMNVGLALCGGSATAIQIVALGLLQRTNPSGKARISAFTTFGMVYPIAFLVLPIATARLLAGMDWRVVPWIWAGAGVLIAFIARTVLEPDGSRRRLGEWRTSLLAGMALAGVVRTIVALSEPTTLSLRTLAVAVGTVAIGIALVMIWRRNPAASPSPRLLADERTRSLLIGVATVSLIGTLVYITLALRTLYGLNPFDAALTIAPAQVGGIVGAKVIARQAINRWGYETAGRRLMLVLAFTFLPLLALQQATPAWYLVASATLFYTAAFTAITVLNAEVMSTASESQVSSTSAFRAAASSIGTAVSVVALGVWIVPATQMAAKSPDAIAAITSGLRINGVIACALALAGWLVLRRGTRAPAAPSAHSA